MPLAGEELDGYERVLDPPVQKLDVCYWLNQEAVRRKREWRAEKRLARIQEEGAVAPVQAQALGA